MDVAAPLLARLGTKPARDAVRAAIELTVEFWNAMVKASKLWENPSHEQLDALKRKMTGKRATAEGAEAFELLSKRWRESENRFDPRLVGDWSLEAGDDGEPRLSCEMELPAGVEAELPPPNEKRVAIGGKFLDETGIRMIGIPGVNAWLSFPLLQHWGTVGDDGAVTIHTKMPTVVSLFAEGVLSPIGGASVGLMVNGKELDAMVLSEIHCDATNGRHDIAILIFKPA